MRIVLLISGVAALAVIFGPYGTAEKVGCGLVLTFVVLHLMLRSTSTLTRKQFQGRTISVGGGAGTGGAVASLASFLTSQGATVVEGANEADYRVTLADRGGEFLIRFQGPNGSERSLKRGTWGWPRPVALELSSFIRTTGQE